MDARRRDLLGVTDGSDGAVAAQPDVYADAVPKRAGLSGEAEWLRRPSDRNFSLQR